MGMGATITACYVFLALVLAPVLIQTGVNPLAAHLFVMYCGMLSSITPPIALASYVAATVAQAPFMRTAIESTKLGMVKLFLPFFFVVSPALILQGTGGDISWVICTALVGIALAASSIEGYFWKLGMLPWTARPFFFASGLLLFYPSGITDLVALPVLALGLLALWMSRRGTPAPAVTGIGSTP